MCYNDNRKNLTKGIHRLMISYETFFCFVLTMLIFNYAGLFDPPMMKEKEAFLKEKGFYDKL